MHIKKNDQVIVLAGEYRGKRGKVLMVLPTQNRVIVEGINFISRHTKPSQSLPQGGIIKKEAPIHLSNVMLIDPKSNEPTRVRHTYLESDDKMSRRKVRVAVKSGEMIQEQS